MLVSEIKVLALDVDGVLTDGRVRLGKSGEETKELCFRDLDAIEPYRSQRRSNYATPREWAPLRGLPGCP